MSRMDAIFGPRVVGPEVVVPDPWVAVLAALDQMSAAIASAARPAPVYVEPPDLTAVVQAVTDLKGPASADEIASALARVLQPSASDTSASESLASVAEALKKLEFRLQGVGTQAYGGGAVSLEASSLRALASAVSGAAGTWGYAAGENGTPSLPAGAQVTQITASALGAQGSFTINDGDTITLPYDSTDHTSSSLDMPVKGELVAPTIVFDGSVDAFVVQYTT